LRAADRLLDRYARSLETTARAEGGAFEVVGVEEAVRYEVQGIEFSGRLDRIDRLADGSLMLVDLKTSKMKNKGAMLEAFPKLAIGATENTIWAKSLPGNPQLPLYRHAKSETSALEYLYLGSESKPGKFDDKATSDRLDLATHSEAINAIDTALNTTFFEPWKDGTITTVASTSNARTCRYCEFVTVCPGFLEDEE
jgi:RecB family exonuclease